MKGDTTGQGVVPLRTILRNILNLIDSFETRYKEGLDSYDQEFQELKQFSENLKTDPGYLCKEGEKSVNRKKNRYKDILPFDYTRVILTDYGDVPGSDYINANFIKGASGSSAYIACQGPLPHTVNDFWRMVVECEVQVIVMACNEQESGKHKCENYWVEEEGVEREFGSVTIWLKKSRQVCPDFLVRTMKIRYPNSKGDMEERSVCQFHYSAWPDHGVPLKVRPLLDMVRLIRDCQTSETLPVLVHCSAGCGRTGTICAIDYVWGLLRLGKLTPDFSLFNLVRDMRRQRIAMVQTKDQYILVHRAVRELFEEQLKIIDSHPYANVDINGLPIDLKADLEEPVYETVQFVSSVPRLREDTADAHRKDLPSHPPPPSPPSNPVSNSVHEKFEESYDNRPEEKARIIKVSGGSNSSSSSSSGSKKVNKVTCTPSPPSGSHGEVSVIESRSTSDHELENSKRGPSSSKPESSSSSSKQGSAKSSLLRNPSIVKLKAFFEKSKDDKEKKVFPGLSRAKSDVSSSSRFYTNLASTFTSRANRNAPSEIKSSEITPPPKAREKTPVEKIKSKPALLSKPNISVKRSKSLKIVRPIDNSRENVNLISSVNIGSDMPDGSSVNLRGPSSSQHVSPDSHSIKVNVHHVEMPKLQKPVSKSVKPESFKATTSHERDKRAGTETLDNFSKRVDIEYHEKVQPPKKPDVPSKSHLLDKVFIPSSTDLYGTTRIKIGISLDDSAKEHKANHSKMNGKIKKYGTVNSKMVSAGGGGTLLTRSQSHVWQPSKPQVPVRIFSDENLSQVGSVENGTKVPTDEPSNKKSFDEPESVRIHRKQSLPITKTTSSSKVKSLAVPTYESMDFKSQEEQQPRSLTLTSHSSFLEARKRVPKTNPYANYSPSANEARNYKDLPSSGKGNQEKGGSSPLTQFHFGENIPLLKNGGNNSLLRNSSESSSNPGTPRNSLPGTPTQSTDVLYSPVSVNTSSGNYNSSGRNQSKSFLKGSLSSTPSESDERLDVTTRNPFSSSMAQSQVTTNITGPQKISSVRTGVGVRERRNSFRQAVWKEDQRAPPNKEEDKSENIYITTTSSVPYFVKSSAMPVHHNAPLPGSMSSSYITPATSAMTTSISNNVSTTTALERTHRDYEPIWPDPGSSTNPFKIGIAEKRTTHLDAHNALMDKSHRLPSSNSSASLGEDKLPTLKSESQVQDRMAEIKVLLEELKAPGKIEGQMQRMNVQMDSRTSQIPTRKINEKQSQSFLDKPQTTGDSRPAAGSGLRYHRSLRAPSRPQYQQGFACFTFKKPSSFESITDQVYAEELMSTKTHGKEDAHSSNDMGGFQEDPFQQSEKSHLQNQRLNDYVSLRNCKTASVSHNNRDGRSNEPTSSQNHHPLHHQALSKSESTPVPPPRSKRGGGVRRDLGNYVNVLPDHQMFSNSNHGWTSKEPTTTNGFHDNHSFSNGTTMAIRKDSSPDEEELSRSYQANGQDYSRISSAGSIPLLNNTTNNNASSTSPKAIIRALGLFQAKAANVRSRLANWSENKERPGTKRTN